MNALCPLVIGLVLALAAAPAATAASQDRPAARAVPAQAGAIVDLELLLAVDVSISMDADEQKVQRQGYVAAFRDPAILRAVRSGPNGRIAVAYMEWAGAPSQMLVLDWRMLDSDAATLAFADDLEALPISRARRTSISAAIERAATLIATNGYEGLRKVIDVSGDGPNNDGRPVTQARDDVVAGGTIINGLALMMKRPTGPYSYFDIPDLDRYYHDCVIGGPGSFVLPVQSTERFAEAIKQKLLLEIAGIGPPASKSLPVQHIQLKPEPSRAPYDCLIGEKRWMQYLNDQW